jgi:hypothetical protein
MAAYSTLGGYLNLSGSLERSLVDAQLACARAVYDVRLGEQSGPPSVSAFIGVSSPFGPLLLGYVLNSAGGRMWTLSFGNLIRNDDQ